MSYQLTRRPPYFDWRLDRWKIGLALLLWLGLILFPPAPPTRPDPQGASPVARPGQRPLVGASTQVELIAPTPLSVEPISSPLETPPAEVSVDPKDAERSDASPLLTLAVWEPGSGPLRNSTPVFFGQTQADGLVEILLEGRRDEVQADSTGYWQFAPAASLPVGMTWIQARLINADGSALSPLLSHIALIGPDAVGVPVPDILTPLPPTGPLQQSTPPIAGIGPAGMELLFYTQADKDGEARPVGQTTVDGDGTWRWQVSALLAEGSRLWAMAVDGAGTPLSRSWPVGR